MTKAGYKVCFDYLDAAKKAIGDEVTPFFLVAHFDATWEQATDAFTKWKTVKGENNYEKAESAVQAS